MRTLFSDRRIATLIASSLALLGAGSGCGNLHMRAPQYTAPRSSMQGSVGYQDGFSNGGRPGLTDYTCESGKSITPKGIYRGPDVDHYQVCLSKNTIAEVLLFGEPWSGSFSSQTPRICAFPVEKTSNGSVFYKPISSQNTTPIHSCVSWSSKGMKYVFNSVNFNGLIVVTESNVEMLKEALMRGDPNLSNSSGGVWPDVSTGIFR